MCVPVCAHMCVHMCICVMWMSIYCICVHISHVKLSIWYSEYACVWIYTFMNVWTYGQLCVHVCLQEHTCICLCVVYVSVCKCKQILCEGLILSACAHVLCADAMYMLACVCSGMDICTCILNFYVHASEHMCMYVYANMFMHMHVYCIHICQFKNKYVYDYMFMYMWAYVW